MPILPYPSVWTLRVPKGSALTHVELDDNQIYLNKKINDTIGQNIGSGVGVYFNKFINPDDGQLLFKSFIGVSGVSVTDSISAITISSSGNYCDLADGIQAQKVRSCNCESYQILGDCDCGTIGLRSDGVTFNPNSVNSYRFPCYDGPTGYHLQTDGAGVLSWVAGGGSGATSGDSYISNVTLTSGDTICITRSDGYEWCISLSAVTPYEYGEGFHSIQPRKDINYAKATSSNIGGGSGNTVYETGLFSNIGGGQENDIYTKQSFIGGGRYNLIHALPTIATGSTSATTSWTGITYSGLTFSACTGGTWSATTYVTTAHTGSSFTEYAYSAVTFNSNHSSIVGGKYNKIFGPQAFIGGGEYNEIYSFQREVFGATIPAQQAYVYKVYSAFTYTGITPAVSGGCSGETYTGITYSGITDTGFTNTILVYSGVTYKTSFSSIVGGERNTVHSYWSSIGGGSGNTITTASTKSIIVGGHGNRLQETELANIVGGAFNLIESPTEGFTGTTYNNKLSSIVGGYKNQLFSTLTFIGGGSGNTITSAATDSTIVGGQSNLISGATHSAILGGSFNKNLGADYASIVGGSNNVIYKNSDTTFIGGGSQNKILGVSSDYASIVGGLLNALTSSTYSTVVSGVQNIINDTTAGGILGGYLNKLYDADYAFIGGGDNNKIDDDGYNAGVIVGGQEHIITGSTHAGIVSGQNNRILGNSNFSIIGGGHVNLIDGGILNGFIGGGGYNKLTEASNFSAIAGGRNNLLSVGSTYGFIGSGEYGKIETADWSVVGGGAHNKILSNSNYSSILGGSGSTVSESLYSSIGGGVQNRTFNSSYSRIGGGDHNRITSTSTYSLIGGGQRNNVVSASTYSSVVGGYENTIQNSRNSILGGGVGNKIISTLSNILGGGQDNLIAGGTDNGWNVLAGGRQNIIGKDGSALTTYDVIGGGYGNKISGSSRSNIVGGSYNLITDSDYAHVGGGSSNHITASTYGIIVGGRWNSVFESVGSSIVSGIENLHYGSEISHIGGGSGNTITSSQIRNSHSSTIGGGMRNTISGSTKSFIGGGMSNKIQPFAGSGTFLGGSVVVGGQSNKIHARQGYSFIGGGLSNLIQVRENIQASKSFIGGGIYNQILGSNETFLGGGFGNIIYSTKDNNIIVGGKNNSVGQSYGGGVEQYSTIVGGRYNKILSLSVFGSTSDGNFIGGGEYNEVTGTSHSAIVGGYENSTYDSKRGFIGGGRFNLIKNVSSDGVIVGGFRNEISASTSSIIGGGYGNRIYESNHSSIVGGSGNTINQNSLAASILNGRLNTILNGHDYSVIMGGENLTSDRAYTTFMNGLDVDTNAGDGTQKSFKYHGTFANQGINRFLKDITGAGDAQWADLPLVPSVIGDCPVVSAWTVGCILYMFASGSTSACTGTTITANTCDNFTGPYRWKGGIDSISTTLPLTGQLFENIVTAGARYSNIQGGLGNLVNNVHFAGILNGSGNTITEKAIYSAVVGTRDRTAINAETTYTRGIDADTDGVDGVNRPLTYHGTFANQGINRFLKDVTGGGDAQWTDLPLIPSVIGDCPVVSAWTQGCILYMFTSGGTSGCTGTTITANTCDNIAGPYRWKGGDKSISTTLPISSDPFENIVTLGSRYSNIQGGLKNLIDNSHYGGILNGSGNTISDKAMYSAVLGTRDRTAREPETTYTRGINANTDGVDGANRYFKYHGTAANPGIGKVLTCINAAGDAVWDFGGINLSGDCTVTSAYTSGCTLYMVTNCTGTTGLLINGNIAYTANTCNFETGPYVFKGGNGSISTRLPGVSITGENFIHPNSHWSNIDGGYDNQINVGGVGMSGILAGQKNIIGSPSQSQIQYVGYNMIGSGYQNRIHGIDHYGMFIGAGMYNIITGSTDSIIGAGYRNKILPGTQETGIFTGRYNTIASAGAGQVNSHYSAILNGSGNTISGNAASSAIIGSDARVATQSQTTYVRGLDALTNSKDGHRKFKYHGTFAQPGLGKVLVDSDGLGNSQWQKNTNPGVSWTGDCAVVSAYTTGCILYMVTDCTGATGTQYIIQNGNIVYTADTCNAFSNGPYRFGSGFNSIETVLNNNFADAFSSNITGGLNNRVVDGNWNSIVGGIDNQLTGYSVSVIVQGHHNRVLGDSVALGYSTILNGYENINRHEYSTILNGRNIVTDRDYTTFGNGLDLNTNAGDGTQQSFKYYGTLANPGLGKVLTDIDGLGNAAWVAGSVFPQTSGCPITSAFTSGCVLYLINCTGGTITADTCNSFGTVSPYEYGVGSDSIKPILGSLQTLAPRASIGGGSNNHIPGGRNARIGGGTENVISGATDGGILSGYRNVITQSQQSSIGGGRINTIGTSTLSAQFSFIGGGFSNDIKGSYGYNFIGGGSGNRLGTSAFAVGQGWSTIGGGSGNSIYGPYLTYSTIGGGVENMITGSSQSFLGGGGYNHIFDSGKASYATIVGGRNNKVNQSGNSFIGGGGYNIVKGSSVYSSIVGGSGNTIGPIAQAMYSNIQGGVNNTLGGDGPIEYGSIVNGKDNTVMHDYSVIMGSRGISSNRVFTTFVTGLDANTVDADGGTQLFKYHGAPANPGLGKVLVDSTGSGHAVWADNLTPGVGGWTGDCAVVSAFTQDCLLYMMTNCTGGTGSSWILVNGNITYTANTCNTFSESPYKYGAGNQTIVPKLPIGALGNHTSTTSQWSNITGGIMNTVSAFTSTIGGGYFNKIESGSAHFIGSGFMNAIYLGTPWGPAGGNGGGFSSIVGGSGNYISANTTTNTGWHFIGGGQSNTIMGTGIQFNSILGGNQNGIHTDNSYSSVVGGFHNKIKRGSNYSSILTGDRNLIDYNSNWSSILAGSGNTIYSDIGVSHGAIVNGKFNKVRHDSSAVIGADRRFTEQSHVTYTNGVDIDTDLDNGGTRYLKYHGSLANPTIPGRVLTDVDGLGNAVWAESRGNSISISGDQYVVSAYTTGCTLFITTNSGNTFTANTCNTFGSVSPYENRATNSISTVLPNAGTVPDNFIGPVGSQWNNIQGGTHNKINQGGQGYAAIGGGYENVIGNPFVNQPYGNGGWQVISGGYKNRIQGLDHYYDGIGSGRINKITSSGYSFIGGGNENTITGTGKSFIGGGESNLIIESGGYGAIAGGLNNQVRNSYGFIGGGVFNRILGPSVGVNTQFSGIVNGSGNTIGGKAIYSAIIGSRGLTAVAPETTYMRGLDIMTEGFTGSHLMRYHGASAGPGIGKFLMDVNGTGDAVWQSIPGVSSWSGDCGIVSAFTTNNGCTLTLVNCTGGTITADTCSSMSGPYAYRGGSGSISTTLPLPNAANENLVGPFTTNSNIDGGLNNKIYTKGRNHSILGGLHNRIGVLDNSGFSMTHHTIVGGSENTINGNDTHYSIIGGGYSNLINRGVYNGIFSGRDNDLTGSSLSIIVGGEDNQIKHSSWSIIAGGEDNILEDNNYTFIGGGADNKVINGGTHSSIVGGSGNTIGPITTAKWSNIQGGENNTLGGDGPITHASIVNGKNNTVQHDYSVILGSKGRTSNKTNTTFVTGLDAQTNDVDGVARYFKYHGALANNGAAGQVLTDVGGTGNATWQPLPNFPNVANLTGCSIVSAFTTNNGCDLNLIDCTGGTYTVDICSTFNGGPYQYGAGLNAIEPVLGSNKADTIFSNIGGGINNKIANFGVNNVYSSIVGGVGNQITGSSLSVISSGQKNKIFIGDTGSKGYGGIYNGFQNKVVNQYSVIMGGSNMTTNRDFTVFMRGLDVDTDATDPLGATQQSPFKYHGAYANPGINKILTDIDGTGNAVWMPCSTACSGSTGGGTTGTTKHVDVRNYTANVKETITHGLSTEDVIVNVWTENKQKIDAEIFYVNLNQIEIAVSMDLNNVKTVIIG